MCLPSSNENELKCSDPPFYNWKLGVPGITDIMNNNSSLVELFADIADNAFEIYGKDVQLNIDAFGQLDNVLKSKV